MEWIAAFLMIVVPIVLVCVTLWKTKPKGGLMNEKNFLEDDRSSAAFAGGLVLFACLGAWFTHIVVCLAAGKWGFLIAGAIFFPIALIHGFGCWIGAW